MKLLNDSLYYNELNFVLKNFKIVINKKKKSEILVFDLRFDLFDLI